MYISPLVPVPVPRPAPSRVPPIYVCRFRATRGGVVRCPDDTNITKTRRSNMITVNSGKQHDNSKQRLGLRPRPRIHLSLLRPIFRSHAQTMIITPLPPSQNNWLCSYNCLERSVFLHILGICFVHFNTV